MQVISSIETNPPRLGIVLLDLPHLTADFGLFTPEDERGIGSLPRGWFESPASWPTPTAYMVARGASAGATLAAEPVVERGVSEAVGRLSEFSDLIIGDCGFFWSAREAASSRAECAVMLSGLDLIASAVEAAGGMDVGVLTYSASHLEPLLASHPHFARLRILGLSGERNWAHLARESYGLRPRWTREGLASELRATLERAFAGGIFDGVGALVIECTVMPQFRPMIRSLTTLPIFDIASISLALLCEVAPVANATGKDTDDRCT